MQTTFLAAFLILFSNQIDIFPKQFATAGLKNVSFYNTIMCNCSFLQDDFKGIHDRNKDSILNLLFGKVLHQHWMNHHRLLTCFSFFSFYSYTCICTYEADFFKFELNFIRKFSWLKITVFWVVMPHNFRGT